MESLQSYLFENSEDFSEKHYVNLMALLLKAHNEKVRTVCVERPFFVEARDEERINLITERLNINRQMIISEDYWNNELKDIIDSSDEFICKLKLYSIDNWEPTRYILPECVTSEHRQKIHIFASQSFFTTFTKRNNNNNTLNIFIR
jgi:hypothetical protein